MLLFQNNKHRTSHKRYFFPTVEIRNWNAMTDGRNVFDQPVKNDMKAWKQ